MDWIYLAQFKVQCWALVKTVMNVRVPYKARNFLTIWVTNNFSSKTVLHVVSY